MTSSFTCTLNNHLVNVSSKEELDKSLIWKLRIKQTFEVLITKKINRTTEVIRIRCSECMTVNSNPSCTCFQGADYLWIKKSLVCFLFQCECKL